jgi:hypothetical protein
MFYNSKRYQIIIILNLKRLRIRRLGVSNIWVVIGKQLIYNMLNVTNIIKGPNKGYGWSWLQD